MHDLSINLSAMRDNCLLLYREKAIVSIFSLFLWFCSFASFANNDWASDKEWENLKVQHTAGRLADTLYFQKAQVLTEKSFNDPSLKRKLSVYRKIAWSETVYGPFRVKYYAFLANHATLMHQEGFAVYYLQKMEEELMQIKPYVSSLNQPRLLLSIYGDNARANLDKRIAIIDSVMPFLNPLPAKLAKQPIPINTCVNAFTILKHSSQLYLSQKDTAKVLQILDLSLEIWKQLKKTNNPEKGKMELCRLSLYLIEYNGAKILSEKNKEAEILRKAYSAVTTKGSQLNPLFGRPFERTILGRLIDFYGEQDQTDSANYYFVKFKNRVASYKKSESGDGIKFLLYSGKVHALNGNYLAAYQDVLHAYETNDSIISVKMADIQNNMHANLLVERSNEELIVSEKEKQNRTVIILLIVLMLVVTIFLFTRRLKLSNEKAKRRIEELNKMTQIQIAEMEATTNLVQKRMGMELHDDIAGRLVNICNFIETKAIEEKDQENRNVLAVIGEMTRDAYMNTRSKSHEWYFKGLEDGNTAFSQRILHIVDQALPDKNYEKQIEIDDHSLEQVSAHIRIHILRFIQEAVANILKHAKAAKITLFLYEEDGTVFLQISDNGKGFEAKSKSRGMGLESLKSRLDEIGGRLEIASSGKGTEILFSIPVNGRVMA